jgi:hypothetical protein
MPSIPSKNRGGDCYEAAGKYVMDHALFPGTDGSLILVHGEVTGQGDIAGIQYGHAWVEKGGTVIDVSNGRNIKLPKAVYYAIGNIGKTYKYTSEEMREKILESGHWGPWDLKTKY